MSDHPSPPAVRIGDAERDAAEARLHRAVGAGQLTLDEFSERMTAVLAARVQSDLDAILADLPATAPGPARAPAPAARGPVRRWLVAIMSGETTRGRWRPAPQTNAVAVMGGVEVDLREAEVPPEGFTLTATALMGGVEVIVPDDVAVEVGGLAFMGGREVTTVQPADPDAPVVRIHAYALMGGVEIRNPTRKERERAAKRAGGQPAEIAPAHRQQPARGSTALEPTPPRSMEHSQGSSWFGRALAAAATAAVTSPFWLPGEPAVAAFGSRTERVSAAEAATDPTYNASAAFGSVRVVVPDGTVVDDSGLAAFGSYDCPACGQPAAPGARTVTVRGGAAFGSVTILTQSQARELDARDAAEEALEEAEERAEDAREEAEDAGD